MATVATVASPSPWPSLVQMLLLSLYMLWILSAIGVVLSASLWAVGAFGSSYTKSITGKRGLIVCSRLGLALSVCVLPFQYGYGGAVGGIVALVEGAVVMGRGGLAGRAQKRAAQRMRAMPLSVLRVVSVMLPSKRRMIWLDETWDILTEVRGRRHLVYFVDAVVKLPLLAWHIRVSTPQVPSALPDVAAEPDDRPDRAARRRHIRRAAIQRFDAVVASSAAMYGGAVTLVSSIVAFTFITQGLPGIIANLDNFVALGAALGYGIRRLRLARRTATRSGNAGAPESVQSLLRSTAASDRSGSVAPIMEERDRQTSRST